MNRPVVWTDHAVERLAERVRIPLEVAEREVVLAIEEGRKAKREPNWISFNGGRAKNSGRGTIRYVWPESGEWCAVLKADTNVRNGRARKVWVVLSVYRARRPKPSLTALCA